MEPYNLATDCIDKHLQYLQTKDQVALTVVEAVGDKLKHKSLTFSNLARLTNRFANALRALGVKPGERLLIRLPNCAEFPVAFLGAIKAGVIPVPTSPLLKAPELQFLLDDSEGKVLVTSPELLPEEIRKPQHVILVGEASFTDLIKAASSQFAVAPTQPDDPAFWLYTSGTEGTPKAVIHAHRSIPAHDERVKRWQDLKYNDVVFNTSALNWSYALTAGMLDCWRHRVSIVTYQGPPEAEVLCKLISKFKVTVLMSVPGIYRRITRHLKSIPSPSTGEGQGGGGLHKVRVALSAGEALTQALRDQFKAATELDLYEGLGMTEHSVYLVQRYGEAIVAGSCGQPLPNHRVAVLNEDLSETGIDEIGILASHRSCPGLMLGYRDEPDPWTGDWFLSGDLARRDEAGNFYFMGRRDDVLTVGGYRVSPLEVETVLNEYPLVAESGVVAHELDGKMVMIAYIVPTIVGAPLVEPEVAEELIFYAREHLADYKIPRKVFIVEALPRTRNGKLKRAALRGI